MNNVNQELGRASPYTQTVSLNDSNVRSLFQKTTAASAISMSDGWGKSNAIIVAEGGDVIYTVGNYKIHVWYQGSGTFKITQASSAKAVQIICAAGGGGGDYGGSAFNGQEDGGDGGTGGSGGAIKEWAVAAGITTSNFIVGTNYTVTLGAGGSNASSGSASSVAYNGGTYSSSSASGYTYSGGEGAGGNPGVLGGFDPAEQGGNGGSGGNSYELQVLTNTEKANIGTSKNGGAGGGGGGGGSGSGWTSGGGSGGLGGVDGLNQHQGGSGGNGGNGNSSYAGQNSGGSGQNAPGMGSGGGGGGGAGGSLYYNQWGGTPGNGSAGIIYIKYQYKD